MNDKHDKHDTPETVKQVYKVKVTPYNPYSGEPCGETGYILFEAGRIEEIRAANPHYGDSSPLEIAISHANHVVDTDECLKYRYYKVEGAVLVEMTCREMLNTPPVL